MDGYIQTGPSNLSKRPRVNAEEAQENDCSFCTQTFTNRKARNQHKCPFFAEVVPETEGVEILDEECDDLEVLPCPWSPNSTVFTCKDSLKRHIDDLHSDGKSSQVEQIDANMNFVTGGAGASLQVEFADAVLDQLPLVMKVSGDAGSVFASAVAASQVANGDKHYQNIISDMKKQISECTDFQPFLCSKCGLLLRSSDECRKHLIDFHMAPSDHSNRLNGYASGNSSVSSKTEEVQPTDRHMSSYECSICKKVFSTREFLFEHSVDVHRRKVLFECSQCSKIFQLKVDLNRHLAVHQAENDGTSAEKSFDCEHCGKKFAFESYLRRHVATHTGEGYYKCDQCKEVFRSQGQMVMHKAGHTGDRGHACNVCLKVFPYKSYLDRHMQTHNCGASIDCQLCSKSFSVPSALVKHQALTHGGEGLLSCTLCSKKFMYPSYLDRHMSTHTVAKEQECPVCHKRFALRSALLDHLKAHFPSEDKDKKVVRPHMCIHCGNRYKHEANLDRHVRKVHE